MTDDEKYLKETLNQVCKNTGCLYEFFIKNAIASDYHRIHLSIYGRSFAAFSFENSYAGITQCPKSYKVRLGYTTCETNRCDSFKLIGKYI